MTIPKNIIIPLVALTTAILLNLAPPPINAGPVALIALIPLLTQMERRPLARFTTGWLAGLLFQAVGYYWIFYTIRDFGGLNTAIAATGAFLFFAYQGMDLALWLWLTPYLTRDRPVWQKVLITASTFLIIHDLIYPYIFPWRYGAMLIHQPLNDHILPWLNVQSLTWMVVAAQAGFALTTGRRRLLWLLSYPAALLPFALIPPAPVKTENWRIAVIQPNLIPWAKQGGATIDELFQAHYQPTLTLEGQTLDMILWPETGLSFNLAKYPYYIQQLQTMADRYNAAVVVGALELNPRDQIYNSVWMFTPHAASPQKYRKEKLVWFSESVPWIFSWAKMFDPGMGAFAPGIDNQPFQYRNRKITPLVCYEALMTWYVADHAESLLINLTNDAWFGRTKASAQHLSQIQPRAAENRVPLVRATNSGISCWIDTNAVVHDPSPLYQKGAFVYQVPVPFAKPKSHAYAVGRLLQILASVLCLLAGSAALVNHFKRSRPVGKAARNPAD